MPVNSTTSLPRVLQQAGDLLVDAVFLDGAAAIGQQHFLGDRGQLGLQGVCQSPLAEIHMGGIGIGKVFHN